MSIATSTAIGIGVSAAGAIGGAALSAHAAGKAASTQAQAADQAAELQHEDAQAALQFQEQEFAQQQQNLAPWLQSGASGLVNLDSLMGILPSSFSMTPTPGTFGGSSPAAANPWATPEAQLTVPQNGLTPGSPTRVSRGGVEAPGETPGTWPGNWPGLQSPGGITSAGGPNGPPITGLPADLEAQGQAAVGAGGGPLSPLNPGSPNVSSPALSNGVPLSSLVNPALGAPGSLMQQWQFQFAPPTDVTEQNDPGFQFRLQQGQQALENSAAARGGLLSGGTAKALERYAQDYSSNEYQNVFNRSLTDYQQAYNQFQQAQANQFNRLAAISGVGQTAAQQLNSAGASAAGNVGNILLGSGQQIGQDIQNAGAARASGYVGAANSYSNVFSDITGSLLDALNG